MLKIHAKYVDDAKAAASADDLHSLLQNAIQLEHATIPPYLTAAYSLKQGVNTQLRDMIVNIAEEEMLHMAVAANVLNAIGGQPLLSDPAFLPTYPGPLPMCIGDDLIVGLKKFSKEVVRDVFMKIEEPENPIHFPQPEALSLTAPEFATIGEFYAAIIEKIEQLGDGIFTGDPARQVVANTGFPSDQLFEINNVETAARALARVVEEGEGTKTIPFDDEGEPAHYYRFESIVRGRELIEDPNAENGFSFSGAEIQFDPDGVWDFPDDTKAVDYPEGSEERTRVDAFNQSYSDILRVLQQAFDGEPQQISTSIIMMFQLRGIAQAVVSRTNPVTGRQCGLTFEHVPPTNN